MTKKRAAFLDRDGVINVPTGIPHTYITDWEDFEFLPGVDKAISKLNEADYLVLVITNQRGVSRGALSVDKLDYIHLNMKNELASRGARIDGVFVCPHEGNCGCRKPETGLFEQACDRFEIDKNESFMIGDSESDILAGHAFGVRAIYVGNKPGSLSDEPDVIATSLLEAVNIVCEGELK